MRSFQLIRSTLGIGVLVGAAAFAAAQPPSPTQPPTQPLGKKGVDLAAYMKLAPALATSAKTTEELVCRITNVSKESFNGERTATVRLVAGTIVHKGPKDQKDLKEPKDKKGPPQHHGKVIVTHKVPPLAPGKSFTFKVRVPATELATTPPPTMAVLMLTPHDSIPTNDHAVVKLKKMP